MSEEPADVGRLLGFVAADLDQRGYKYVGTVRRAARLLLDVPDVQADGCRGCGADLDQPHTGRRRVWCSEACRSRTRRR